MFKNSYILVQFYYFAISIGEGLFEYKTPDTESYHSYHISASIFKTAIVNGVASQPSCMFMFKPAESSVLTKERFPFSTAQCKMFQPRLCVTIFYFLSSTTYAMCLQAWINLHFHPAVKVTCAFEFFRIWNSRLIIPTWIKNGIAVWSINAFFTQANLFCSKHVKSMLMQQA